MSHMKKTVSVLLTLVLLFSLAASAAPTAFAATEYTSGNYTYTVSGTNATITAYPETASGKVTVPSKLGSYSVTAIGAYAFYACTLLTEVKLPNTVKKIGDYAFAYCTSLASIEIRSGVTAIGANTFKSSNKVVIACEAGSYAESYAKENGIKTKTIASDSSQGEDTPQGKTHKVTYNYAYNGGDSATKATATVREGDAIDLHPTAEKSGWTFLGWNTNASATTKLTSLKMGSGDVVLYAIYRKILTATFIDYSGTTKTTRTEKTTIFNRATSGTVTAPTQNAYTGWSKRGWTADTAANASVTTKFSLSAKKTFYGAYQRTLTLSYNANGGNTTPAKQTGTQYANSYKISNTKNPTFTLAAAISKSGAKFDKWAVGSTSGTKYAAGSSVTIAENKTMYATWKTADTTNIYNLGDETYSFRNYSDADSWDGHCFGMAVTSSGYYLGTLSKTIIGGKDETPLYKFSDTATVRKPICYYLPIQGPGAEYESIVAGGSCDLNKRVNTKGDWTSCVNYVKNHKHDNKGDLNVGMWFAGNNGGHAVNFLYYKEVGGQQRIYVYDNNFPTIETYYYLASDGYIHQAPRETFGAIMGLDLMDVNNYFKLAPKFKSSRYVYTKKSNVVVEGATMYYMKCGPEAQASVMYELPKTFKELTKISIKPLINQAMFRYLGKEYSFAEITEATRGILEIKENETGDGYVVRFTIVNAPGETTDPEPTPAPAVCPWCGEQHTGALSQIIVVFHDAFAKIFGARY